MACEQQHPLYDEITMYKRKDDDKSPWQYRFYVSSTMNNGGKAFDNRKSTGSKDEKEALKIAAAAYERFSSATKQGEKVTLSGQVTVDDCFKRAKEVYQMRIANGHNRPSTWATIEKNYTTEIQPHFGKTPVVNVDRRMWNDYLIDLTRRKPNLSKDYKRLIKGALRVCLNHADELVEDFKMPLLKDGLKLTAQSDAKRVWFGIDEQYQLLKALDENVKSKSRPKDVYSAESLRDFCHLMLYTGLRPEELRVIRFCDVQLQTVKENGKRFRVTVITVPNLEGAKTGGRETVGVKGSGAAFYRTLKRRGCGNNSHEKLFDQNNRSRFVQILDELDIRHDKKSNLYRTFESLRHSFISNRYLEGENVNSISKNVGNSPAMIAAHYTNHITKLDFEKYKKFHSRQKLREDRLKGEEDEFQIVKKREPVKTYEPSKQMELGEKLHAFLKTLDEDEEKEFKEQMTERAKDALSYYHSMHDEYGNE